MVEWGTPGSVGAAGGQPPAATRPRSVAGLGVPPLQHARQRRGERARRAAVGRPMLIARELEGRALVPVFDRQAEAPERCCLITTAASRGRPEVQAFREWVLREAEVAGRRAAAGFLLHP